MPADVDPQVAAALRTQLQRRAALLADGAAHVGWKLGYGFGDPGREPILGHLTSDTVLEDGGAFPAAAARELRAETELVVTAGEDGRVAGLGVALELVDVARPPDALEDIVAANVFHRAVVLGPMRPGPLPSGALARAIVDGEEREITVPAADPERVVRDAARLLAAVGERLAPGDRILSGSSTHVPVGAGDGVEAEIDGLGRVHAVVG
jgi:2-keto-4-pentenoate hydratase